MEKQEYYPTEEDFERAIEILVEGAIELIKKERMEESD